MSCCNGPRPCCNDYDHDREGVSAADVARFGGDDITCPNCGAELYHDAALCSKCGHAISDAKRDDRSGAKPLLFVGLTIAIALAIGLSMM